MLSDKNLEFFKSEGYDEDTRWEITKRLYEVWNMLHDINDHKCTPSILMGKVSFMISKLKIIKAIITEARGKDLTKDDIVLMTITEMFDFHEVVYNKNEEWLLKENQKEDDNA